MGPINWLAVFLAANLAVAVGIVWNGPLFRTGRPLLGGPLKGSGGGASRNYGISVLVMLIGAAMLGHALARIGADRLAAKPWLYWMQSGGVGIAFVVPAVLLTHLRNGTDRRSALMDAGFWLAAYLAMGTVFWALR